MERVKNSIGSRRVARTEGPRVETMEPREVERDETRGDGQINADPDPARAVNMNTSLHTIQVRNSYIMAHPYQRAIFDLREISKIKFLL